jgi:hypothetical protein
MKTIRLPKLQDPNEHTGPPHVRSQRNSERSHTRFLSDSFTSCCISPKKVGLAFFSGLFLTLGGNHLETQ